MSFFSCKEKDNNSKVLNLYFSQLPKSFILEWYYNTNRMGPSGGVGQEPSYVSCSINEKGYGIHSYVRETYTDGQDHTIIAKNFQLNKVHLKDLKKLIQIYLNSPKDFYGEVTDDFVIDTLDLISEGKRELLEIFDSPTDGKRNFARVLPDKVEKIQSITNIYCSKLICDGTDDFDGCTYSKD